MTEEYGALINGALRAVAQMHGDTSKLLVDCDKRIGKGRKSVFGSYATKDLTYNFQAAYWMAEAVFRYYAINPNRVEGVSVAFFDESLTEPIFLMAQIEYFSIRKPLRRTKTCLRLNGSVKSRIFGTYTSIGGREYMGRY